MSQKTVVVLGGGYGGIAVAAALDDVADVLLIEEKDTFVHNVAALRALVDAAWAERIFLPYDRLLARGGVRRDRAVAVDAGTVTLASGDRLEPDYLVLATGSAYPFPAKPDTDRAADSRARLAGARAAVATASSALLVGAGPAGLELAGELREARPELAITIVERAHDIVPGPMPDAFRAELRGQLDALGIELLLGTGLLAEPGTPPASAGPVEVSTMDGHRLGADIWFRCHGGTPNTGYLTGELRAARRADGHLTVTDELRLPGQPRIFAIGDVTAVPETKLAKAAELHADAVARTIRAELTGTGGPVRYLPAGPGMSLPLGTRGGASYNERVGVLGATETAELKGAHLRLDRYRAALGLPT